MSEFYWDHDPAVRTKHLYIPGQSGYGKTSLMANLALDDLATRKGPVVVIDPKGSREGLVARIIPHIPPDVISNVFYISQQHPAPIELLDYKNQQEKNQIKHDLVHILRQFSENWGTTMQSTMNTLVPTLLEVPDATFLDVGRFLDTKSRQKEILKQVSDERRQYWEDNKPNSKDAAPIVNRMSNFYDYPLSTIVGARRGEGINIAEIIEKKQVLLIDCGGGNEDDGLMLGALVMSKIQQAIFRRDPDRSHPVCSLYVDEFHNLNPSRSKKMITEGRSFGLSLCFATQQPKQLDEIGIWDTVKGGVSTYIIFRQDGEHAAMLRSKIREPEYTPAPLTREMRRCRIEVDRAMEASLLKGLEWEEEREKLLTKPLPYKTAREHLQEVTLRRQQEEEALKADLLTGPEVIPKLQKPIMEQIPSLEVGEAVFIQHTGRTTLVRVRKPRALTSRGAVLQRIVDQTAQIGKKRTVDSTPFNSSATPHNKENGNRDRGEPTPSGDAAL